MAFVLNVSNRDEKIWFSEKPDKLEVIEMRLSHRAYEFQRTQIPDVDVGLWSTKSSLDEIEAPALLRLVWIPSCDIPRPWELDARKSSVDTILKNFGLEEAYRYTSIHPAFFALMPARQAEHSDTLTFSLSLTGGFGIAWKHNAKSGRTEGVSWGLDWVRKTMHSVMNKTKAWARHPLFLALVSSVTAVNITDEHLDAQEDIISAVEVRTKYHGFSGTPPLIAEGDYTSLSQKMSACAGVLALVERRHKVLNEFLIDQSLYSQRYDLGDDASSRSIRLEVENCVENLRRRLKIQKIQLDYLSRRVEIQLTALFHLISQQETRVGIAVAEDSRTLASASKEDSTAMKTIAAVTIVFLPGTFIAALFAMPLFQWDAVGDSKVVSNRFWIYWAVTVPLTFLTLLVWVLWTKRQARMHRSSEKRAREELRFDIEGQSDGVEKKEV